MAEITGKNGQLIYACKASGSGHISRDFNNKCASGYHVCTGTNVWNADVSRAQARSFGGCFKFDAAHDCQGCGATCERRQAHGSTPCWDSGRGIDVAGMGSGCSSWAGNNSCLKSGRIDFSTNAGGCNGPLRDGVMCCKD